jgi:hypothetical protein
LQKEVEKTLKKDKAPQQQVQREIEDLQAQKVDALRMKVRKKITNEEYQLLVENNNNPFRKIFIVKQSIEQSLNESSTSKG